MGLGVVRLRQYQNDAILALREGFLAGKQRLVLCLPTGAGKTVVFTEMIRLAALRQTKCLVLTDRIELFEQTFATMCRSGVSTQRIDAGSKRFRTDALVTVGMVETMIRRMRSGRIAGYVPDLIICDEAHKATFNKVYDMWPEAMVVGATATPVGGHFYKYFHGVIQNVDIPELVMAGFLCPARAYQMEDDFSDLEVRAGEFTDDSLFRHFDKPRLYAGVVDEWRNLAAGKKTIVFNVNIAHTERMTQSFRDAGVHSECVTSNTPPDERKRILAAFRDGIFHVLNNCGILTTGYDEPSIECVVMNRATKSLPLWLQCCGRGSRPHPGKSAFIVLDFGQNHNRMGRWDEPRTYQIKPPKDRSKLDVAGVKNCPKCRSILFASARTCQYCGHVFPQSEVQEHGGVMREVANQIRPELVGKKVSELTLDELLELEDLKRLKSSYIWRVLRTRGPEYLAEWAKLKGYDARWIGFQSQGGKGYTNYTIK